MKRALSSVIFAGVTILALGQGSFTIVRPFDGSKVREMVKVYFPKNSVPEGSGYIGIFIDGEFLEAIAPRLSADKKYFEYTLDTKALADGSHKLEAKLYVDYSNQPRIVDTSSVEITVANKSSIPVPEDGFKLRYKFVPGAERIYRLQERTIENVISEADQKKQGSRPFQIQQDGETLKMLYACDNAYGNGDGLIRMQVVPDKGIKGREFSYVTTSEATTPARFYPENMSAVYMRISSTGREVFGAVPEYFGLEGNAGQGVRLGLYATFPLPTLPTKGVKPGDTWQSNFQDGSLDMQHLFTLNSVVDKIPTRGEFLGVEWEMGHPCAKIRNTISEGSAAPKLDKKDRGLGDKISDRKITLEETIWFALDTGVVVKFFRDETFEGKGDLGLANGGSGGSGGSGPAPAGLSGAGGGNGGKGGGGKAPGDFQAGGKVGNNFQGGPPPGAVPGGRGPAGFSPPGAPPQGNRGGPPGFNGQGGGSTTAFIRIRKQYLFVLEK